MLTGERRGLAISLLIAALLVAPPLLAQIDNQHELSLPEDCFDTSNTAEPCQILFRYAELLGFANIPDYIGFVESAIAEERGDLPFLPLRETPEFERFTAEIEEGEIPSEAMQREIAQFLSYRMQRYAEFRHAADSLSVQIQDAWFTRLVGFNAQLFPELGHIEALQTTFLQADPRLVDALAQLSPLTDGESVLVDDEAAPQVLTWLTTLYGLDDEYVTESLLRQLLTLHHSGGLAFDLPGFDQMPAIGAMVNAPIDSLVELTDALRDDITQLEDVLSTSSDNTLQNIHFYEPFRVNNLLALLAFVEGIEITLPRIPYATSGSLISAHFYLNSQVFEQHISATATLSHGTSNVLAGILALRAGATLPIVGSHLVQLEDAGTGNYVVVELTPLMARLVYGHTAGYSQ